MTPIDSLAKIGDLLLPGDEIRANRLGTSFVITMTNESICRTLEELIQEHRKRLQLMN